MYFWMSRKTNLAHRSMHAERETLKRETLKRLIEKLS